MPIQHQVVRLSALGLMALGLQGTSWSATISGKVTAGDGRPVSGALVTVFNAERSRKETVYTAPDGSYVNTVDYSGTVTVRARLPYFEDVTREVLVAADKPVSADFVLSKITDPQTLSDSLTASAHLTKVQWKDPVMRDAFVKNCNSCHQLGNATTRIQRDEAGWTATIQKMEFFAVLTNAQQKGIAKALTAGMDGKPVRAIQTYDVGPQLRNAKVHEWLVGDGVPFIHDAIVGQRMESCTGPTKATTSLGAGPHHPQDREVSRARTSICRRAACFPECRFRSVHSKASMALTAWPRPPTA